jgi:hypothetical protein
VHYILTVITIGLFACLSFASTNDISFTIFATGETHAMLYPCDCPREPGGGLAKRASLFRSTLNRNRDILVDAGGFAGGGIYDSYTEGRTGDSSRTILTLAAMGIQKYDAAAIGDDDLQYGGEWLRNQASKAGIMLVSANCFLNKGNLLGKPYVIIKRGGLRFGITALTSQEKILPVSNDVKVDNPVSSLKKIWKDIVRESDFRIIISHLGQENAAALADSFPECDLIVNGHRKSDPQAIVSDYKVPLLQFGFQGKSVSYAAFRSKGNKNSLAKSGWLNVVPEMPDDSAVVKILNGKSTGKAENIYDLYIMGQCPYGLEALAEFTSFLGVFPSVEWNLWFIGTVEKDSSLISLHGEGEIKEEMRWLAVKALYPSKWVEFLKLRSTTQIPPELIMCNLGIDTGKIVKWVNSGGKMELISHYLRSERLKINSSPTLLVNNTPYEKQISEQRLAKIQCGVTHVAQCDTLPECFEDSDCRQKGKSGHCTNGKCEFHDAVKFSFKVIIADSTLQHPEKPIIATTEDLFAGADVEIIKASSQKGKQLISEFKPSALPLYIFSKDASRDSNFQSVENGLEERNGSYVFKDGFVRRNYLLNGTSGTEKYVLFIDPLFKESPGIISSVLQNDKAKRIRIRPVVFVEPSKVQWGTDEKIRQEEAMRWLILDKYYPSKFKDYLKEYSTDPGSSFWIRYLWKLKIPADSFVNKAENLGPSLLENHMKALRDSFIQDPVLMLVNGQELFTISNQSELDRIMGFISLKTN